MYYNGLKPLREGGTFPKCGARRTWLPPPPHHGAFTLHILLENNITSSRDNQDHILTFLFCFFFFHFSSNTLRPVTTMEVFG
jgi:hypothetical protein